jgi:hypothetical protein
MKHIHLICRCLLGLTFTVFGLNGLIAFIHLPPHAGVAGQLMGAMSDLGFLIPVFALQFVAGVLLLANRFVPLALALLAPIIVNILLFHVLMDGPHGLAIPAVLITLWAIVLYPERSAFAGIVSPKPQAHGPSGNCQPNR